MDDQWTDERVDLLKKLRANGMSASDIAGRLNAETGGKFTRSAICGKVNRLQLANPMGPRASKPRARVNTAARPRSSTPYSPLPAATTFKVREIPGGFSVECCAYVESCKEAPVRGRFFCEVHCQIVYVKPTRPVQPPNPNHRRD